MAASIAVKKLRMTLCLQQDEFGKHLGVTGGTICNWESGIRHPRLPKIRLMANLAKDNNVPFILEEFFDESQKS